MHCYKGNFLLFIFHLVQLAAVRVFYHVFCFKRALGIMFVQGILRLGIAQGIISCCLCIIALTIKTECMIPEGYKHWSVKLILLTVVEFHNRLQYHKWKAANYIYIRLVYFQPIVFVNGLWLLPSTRTVQATKQSYHYYRGKGNTLACSIVMSCLHKHM